MPSLELTDEEIEALFRLVDHHESVLMRQEPIDQPSLEHKMVRRLREKIGAVWGGTPESPG
jgi:hypothetical protein